MERVTHKTKATECGTASRNDGLTSWWAMVTCEACLRERPIPIAANQIWRCREGGCDATLADDDCRLCVRCRDHCYAKAPGDELAHRAADAERAFKVTHRRRR